MKRTVLLYIFILTGIVNTSAQQTLSYTHPLKEFDHALELYRDHAYVAAQDIFNRLTEQFEPTSEHRADCVYYAAICAVRLGQYNADELLENFVLHYPNSAKRNKAFSEVANYYFDSGKYSYALKWLKRIRANNLPRKEYEEYLFKMGYSLFANKKYAESKKYFVQLLDSPEYGGEAKYYYGYIAYSQDDYDNADKYLGEVSNDKKYGKEVSYYRADMYFKLGKFQKAIEVALPLLNKTRKDELSQINKIIGESYFNLQQYDKALPYLKKYKGKGGKRGRSGKWVNTDYYQVGYCYYQQKNYAEAISYFNKIIDGNNAVAQNAYYHLGECYLHLDKKTEALNAFRNAAQMEFDPDISRDAFYNYAKLSYDIGNPYRSVPDVLQEYTRKYPDAPERTEIENLVVSAYIMSKDYNGTLQYLEQNKIAVQNQETYQKAAYLQGIQVLENHDYKDAIDYFDKALTYTPDNKIRAKTLFWRGEAAYRLHRFADAYRDFKAVQKIKNTSDLKEHKLAAYHAAYALFKQKKYSKSIPEFEQFIRHSEGLALYHNDALMRLGDVYFVTKKYAKAITEYKKLVQLKVKKSDYAVFQTAICYGFLGKKQTKINYLQKVIDEYPRSSYRDDALYLLGTSYFDSGKTEQALSVFNKLLNEHKNSNLAGRTMMKKALIYYNTNRNEQAIQTYKDVVSRYPNTPIARQAVKNARQIYVDTGNVDEYAAWVKSLKFIELNNSEIDQDMYESADKFYSMNDYRHAISAYQKYLKNFPKGMHELEAHYYLAQSYEKTGNTAKALEHYRIITKRADNPFTEDALVRLAQKELEDKNWDNAVPLLQRLEKTASHEQNILFSRSNLMKAYYFQEKYDKAVSYAESIIDKTNDEQIIADAKVIIARSAMKTGNENKARNYYAQVEKSSKGILKAEALYYKSYFLNKDAKYKDSNAVVQDIAKNYANYKYWGAKALIIMARNFQALDDAYQATYILDSVIKNFKQYEDVVQEAKTLLKQIKTEQAKHNDSVNPE